jgi:hypothetical protein
MKKYLLCFLSFILIFFLKESFASPPEDNILLGITWGESFLVSFDPYTGNITEVHAYLNPGEAFRGLAYDPNNNILYALSQGTNHIYAIDPITLNIVKVGKLDINTSLSWGEDAGALTYDPFTNTLFTVIEHWDFPFNNIWSELSKIDINDASLTNIGNIYGPFISSMSYSEQDGQLYGLAVYGSGSWDSPFKSHVVKINPETAEMDVLFITPYHTMLGFAKKPDENSYTYYSWINWTSHFYGEVNIDNKTITPLGNSDQVDVISAMIYRDFHISSLEYINDLVKFKPIKSTFKSTSDTSGCPNEEYDSHFVRKLSLDARIKNKSRHSLSGLIVEIKKLKDQNLLQNAVGGPGGIGSFLMIPKDNSFSDGVLSRKESVNVHFIFCLTNEKKFKKKIKFSVDVLGVVDPETH